MATMGHIFRETREQLGVTASQAAQATRMKVQHIEDLENDDFSHIPAPAYVKGFIRIYAEYLGLDPIPFIRDYKEGHTEQRTHVLTPEPKESLLRKQVAASLKKMGGWLGAVPKIIYIKLLIAMVVLLVVWGLMVVIKSALSKNNHKAVDSEAVWSESSSLDILEEPPEPYWDQLQKPAVDSGSRLLDGESE